MITGNRAKKFILVLGDIFFLYLSLFVALTIRDFSFPSGEILNMHLFPFLAIYIIWILIFYISGFYDVERGPLFSLPKVAKTIVIGGFAAILLFYLVPSLGIAPKTNMAIDIIIASFFIWGWRNLFDVLLTKTSKIKIFFWGEAKEKKDLIDLIRERPQLKYEVAGEVGQAEIIIVSEEIKQNQEFVQSLYQMLLSGKTIIDFDKFYESLTGKIPVSTIDKAWFLENLIEINKQTFEKFKQVFDIIVSVFFFIVFIILYLPVALAIKLNSPGPVFYKQRRVGKDGKIFDLIKFRSMVSRHPREKDGWQKPDENNHYVTTIGNIIRKTRIDELPQVLNVLNGDLSFVGPRPERPEFVKELVQKIPHYSMRHIIKPGLTGWSQINFSDASAKDALEKLQYDLYYIKNRSFLLDVSIFLKTIMVIFQTSGK
jgi:lipopolysaccharide/colanic/teichoic acid biosynthesis glycosyltransferase